jgi:hypothetical protein
MLFANQIVEDRAIRPLISMALFREVAKGVPE